MAEQGKAKEEDGKGKPEDGTEEKDPDSVFQETLGELYAKDEAKKKAALKPGEGGTGDGAAAAAPAPKPEDGQPKPAEGFTDEDKALLTSWGIPLEKADPQVVTAIKKKAKETADLDTKYKEAEGRATRYASQNKQVSEQYQGLKKDHKALLEKIATDPNNVLDFAKKLLTEEELSKLPKGTQDILRDEDARLAFTYLVTKMAQLGQQGIDGGAPAAELPPTGDPLDQGKKPADGGAPAAELTPEQVKARDEWINKTMTDAGYANYAEVYQSPEFKEYMDPIIKQELEQVEQSLKAGIPVGNIDPELALIISEAQRAGVQVPRVFASPTFRKLRTDAPANHISILRGFDNFKQAKQQVSEQHARTQERSGALEGHGDTKPQPTAAGKTMADLTPEQITDLPAAEFRRLSRDKTAKTTLYG